MVCSLIEKRKNKSIKVPMMNYFTPEETQDYPQKKKVKKAPAITGCKPSPIAQQFVFGYAAALTIFKTKCLGNLTILAN
jgi:hypothetical protein